MSESKIRRKNKAFSVTLDAAVSNATEIVLADMAGVTDPDQLLVNEATPLAPTEG